MSLMILQNISLSYGGEPLFENANLTIEPRERICLIGRNGVGKSTLLKLIEGQLVADSGSVQQSAEISVSKLVQDIPAGLSGRVFDVIAEGLGEIGDLLLRYEQLAQQLQNDQGSTQLDELHQVQQQLEAKNGWRMQQRIETILSKMQLAADVDIATLSGGLVRRVLLAKAIVTDPDILLLDEPTNHLDIEAITWLEEFMLSYPKAIIFITHDRVLLQKIATRIIEIDNGQFYSWPGNYQNYLRRKEEQIATEDKAHRLFDKRLAQEEQWIRQGIKARRTRNEGRVRALERMREQCQQRRTRIGKANIKTQSFEKSGKIIFDAEHIFYAYHDKVVIDDFSTVIMRGDKIGIIGPNGCGKSTLLQVLLGQLSADSGTVKPGSNLTISYFDQRRAQLDENKLAMDNVYDGGEMIPVDGKTIHILTYLKDFLFTPERARMATRVLSGGERNRLLLAKLFTKPFNVLVMDEPTNDLDIETLDLLEEKLLEYQGTLLLVSHDRSFLNNVVTSTLVFNGAGQINEYVGGYDDYIRQAKLSTESSNIKSTQQEGQQNKPLNTTKPEEQSKENKKLSYKQQRELEQLPQLIENLEKEQQQIQQAMLQADFYQQAAVKITEIQKRLVQIEQALANAYQRWSDLEN